MEQIGGRHGRERDWSLIFRERRSHLIPCLEPIHLRRTERTPTFPQSRQSELGFAFIGGAKWRAVFLYMMVHQDVINWCSIQEDRQAAMHWDRRWR